MYFYAQYFSPRTGHWFTFGDEYNTLDEAVAEVAKDRDEARQAGDRVIPDSYYRVVIYTNSMRDEGNPTDRLMD